MLKTCLFCGKVFETQFGASCCSKRCWERARRQTWTCPHNEHLVCRTKDCHRCGWNPEVEARRKRMLFARQEEEPQ
jgi:hypothetical protein